MQTKPSSYDKAVWSAFNEALKQVESAPTPAEVEAICERLLQADPRQRGLLLRNSRRVRRFEVAHRLARRAYDLRHGDVEAMYSVAALAVQVAEAVAEDPEQHGLVMDTRALAWAYLANTERVRNDFTAAQSGWRKALEYQSSGTGDPLLEADLLALRSNLVVEQGHHSEAIEILRQALLAYEQVGDSHLVGRTFMMLGRVYGEIEQPADAIRLYYQALRHLEPGREEQLVLITVLNLASALARASWVPVALEVLAQVAPIYDADPSSNLVLKSRWLEASLLAKAGRVDDALVSYGAVRRSYQHLGRDYQAACSSMDEAVLLAELGRWDRVEELATEMYPSFLSTNLEREATAALMLFVEAVEQQTASVQLLRELKTRVEHSTS